MKHKMPPLPAVYNRCNRALRDEGFAAIPRTCAICKFGHICGRMIVGENWPPRTINVAMPEFGAVPNRLFGATINENGEAV